jgi:Zn-dependent metalloprotease
MSIKHKVLTASILLAITGTTATTLIIAQRDAGADAGNAARSAGAQTANAAAQRNAHAPAAHATLQQPFADASARSGATPQAQLDNHPAVQRARELLQADKARSAAAHGLSGANADAALAAESYQPRDVIVEADGSEHVRFQRDYQGLPVIGGDLVTHAKNGLLSSISKTLDLALGNNGAAPNAKLSSAQAIADAGVHFAGRFLEQPKSRMVYFAKDNQPKLAYEVTFRGLNKAQRPVHDLIYVDADTGGLLGRDSRIYSAESTETSGYTITRGKVNITTAKVGAEESDGRGPGYLLRDDKRGGGTTHNTGGTVVDLIFGGGDFSAPAMFDADNVWGDEQMSNVARTGVEAHYGVARTWDYYKKFYDRLGIFGDGVGVQSFVNVTFSYFFFDIGGTNAFWDGDAKRMVYGNGDYGVSNPVVAIDVAGHEMSHGVTQATSGLLYSGDAGGLNEATSDIHGTLVEFFDNSPKDPPDYLIGENVNLDGTPLRYMFKPSLDKDADGNGSFDCYPAAGFVDEDPHYTSGIGNHFFYLLAEGQKVPKSHRKSLLPSDLVCNGATGLKGLTPVVAGQIWYRANTLYLTSQASYPDARVATQTAAQDLVDRGLLKASAVKTVACAWEAVNVGLPEGSDAARCKK